MEFGTIFVRASL